MEVKSINIPNWIRSGKKARKYVSTQLDELEEVITCNQHIVGFR